MPRLSRRTLVAGLAAAPFFAAAKATRAASALVARDGRLSVRLAALERLEPGGWFLARVKVPGSGAAVVGAEASSPAARRLAALFSEGRAAGNLGDLYDNLDGGHSVMALADHPQLTATSYDAAAQAEGLAQGLGLRLLFDAPLIGNCSMALVGGPFWRSLPRAALTEPGGAERLFRVYGSGALRVFPEHRDHDPEHGDLFPANTPYYLVSQGSSGSDRAHLSALAMILAAFRPETKARLRQTGLLAPTLQMVYRRARRGVLNREAYMSGIAHPKAFSAAEINLPGKVALANAIAPEEIPPMVRLAVETETAARPGVDVFGGGLGERLFDTPSAIARIWRAPVWRREMVVSAAETRDPNGRTLRFTWRLLRGDPARVRIAPLDGAGRRARITMEWQDPRPAPGRADILSPRIDIGVFASNGAQESAPAFLSVLLPAHETRDYEPAPGGGQRIARIVRAAPEGVYADPALFPVTDWTDVYQYDESGAPAGWTRYGAGEPRRYDARGAQILASGEKRRVRYEMVRDPDGVPRLREDAGAPP